MRTMIIMICLVGFWQAAQAQEPAQEPAPKRVAPAEAKNHQGENAIVCGKVVDAQFPRNGLSGHGLPASFYMEEPAQHAAHCGRDADLVDGHAADLHRGRRATQPTRRLAMTICGRCAARRQP